MIPEGISLKDLSPAQKKILGQIIIEYVGRARPDFAIQEMKEITGNPNFQYEISCDQMCGKGHFSMRGVIVVESEEDYNKWLATQKPEYLTLFPEKDPSKQVQAVDSAAATSKPMAQVMSNKP
jgi:hypothetical protein